MWNYEKRLQYPVNIKTPNAKIAQFIMSQYGGPDGEIGASMRYLSQRFAMPNRMASAVLNDVGTEELAHLEMVSTIVHQLTRDLSMEEIEKSGFGPYYIDHGNGIWPQAAGGIPFNACEFQSKGDPVTDLFEDLAAEQKARATYDNILRVVRDIPEIADPIRFLRAREVVHFQRFGEANREVSSKYPGSGKPTPAPFYKQKSQDKRCMNCSRTGRVLLSISGTLFILNIEPQRRRFPLPTRKNRNAAFFMPSCYAVGAERALIYKASRARNRGSKGNIPFPLKSAFYCVTNPQQRS